MKKNLDLSKNICFFFSNLLIKRLLLVNYNRIENTFTVLHLLPILCWMWNAEIMSQAYCGLLNWCLDKASTITEGYSSFQVKWALVSLTRRDFWLITFLSGELTLVSMLTHQDRGFKVDLLIIPLWDFGLHHGMLCKMGLLWDKAKKEDEIQQHIQCSPFPDGTLRKKANLK